MRFYDRETELARLTEIATFSKDTAHLMVITGRRRVGKTELVRTFAQGREEFLYFFVSKKKPLVLLDEFRDLLAARMPLLASVSFGNFSDFFRALFEMMKERPFFVVFDEFQNFQQVDSSVFSTLQDLWDRSKDLVRGTIVCIGSVQTLMRDIFEGAKEPLFGRATARLYVEPLNPDVVAQILAEHHVDPVKQLPFYITLFGGIPKYYFLLDRYRLFGKPRAEIIRKLFCEVDALLQSEGKDLLVEEFGKNYYLYFSILQVVAGGETQMARIADRAGLNVNSISKYLDELTSFYQVIERRLPVTATRRDQKNGRYYLKDPLLRFWFRYIYRNQSLIEIGDEEGLLEKIQGDLSTFMGWSFEELIRSLLLKRNDGTVIPFRFTRIGGFWTRRGDVEIDVVACTEEGAEFFFGECKLSGKRFSVADARRLKEKAASVPRGSGDRREYFALFCMEEPESALERELAAAGVVVIGLNRLLAGRQLR
jgi:hypothetical protein